MKLAILGTRGVPPSYGGFETFAAELGRRLVQRGHEVTVYGRADASAGREWNGIRRVEIPSLEHKYFDTISRTLLSVIDSLRRGFDAALLCNAANAFTLPLLRAARIPVAVNVDGLERKRRKWNALGRAVYMTGEAFCASFATRIVADAGVIAAYYRRELGVDPVTIAYGSDFPEERGTDVLERFGLQPRNYVLYVSRFEPENNPLEVVAAYEKLTSAPPLVMLGQGLYAPDLVAELLAHESRDVRFPGALYGADYRTLQRNALVYIQATEVGGTHPALIEAMGSGGCVLALGTPENREVGGDSIGYFELKPVETLSTRLREWLADPILRESQRVAARARATGLYSWDAVTDAYEALFTELVAKRA